MKINTNGNIYRLATYFDNKPNDFCHLCRLLMWNTFILLVLCALAGAFLGDLVASIAAFITTSTLFWTVSILILAIVTTIFIVFLLVFLLVENPFENESLQLISEFYKSKKHRFCPNLEYN
jgi:predicted membrane protein